MPRFSKNATTSSTSIPSRRPNSVAVFLYYATFSAPTSSWTMARILGGASGGLPRRALPIPDPPAPARAFNSRCWLFTTASTGFHFYDSVHYRVFLQLPKRHSRPAIVLGSAMHLKNEGERKASNATKAIFISRVSPVQVRPLLLSRPNDLSLVRPPAVFPAGCAAWGRARG